MTALLQGQRALLASRTAPAHIQQDDLHHQVHDLANIVAQRFLAVRQKSNTFLSFYIFHLSLYITFLSFNILSLFNPVNAFGLSALIVAVSNLFASAGFFGSAPARPQSSAGRQERACYYSAGRPAAAAHCAAQPHTPMPVPLKDCSDPVTFVNLTPARCHSVTGHHMLVRQAKLSRTGLI